MLLSPHFRVGLFCFLGDVLMDIVPARLLLHNFTFGGIVTYCCPVKVF